jgi:hypothetical protein
MEKQWTRMKKELVRRLGRGAAKPMGVIRFPYQLPRPAAGEITAWFARDAHQVPPEEFEALKKEYGNKLEVTSKEGRPFITYKLMIRSSDHARKEAMSI